jgi:hypothetical protein
MIRCVRMWTGEDGDSLFEEGSIDLPQGTRGDSVGEPVPVGELSFQETKSGGSYEWHQDPVPRYVITLSGTLETFPGPCRSTPSTRTRPAMSNGCIQPLSCACASQKTTVTF